MKKEVIEDLKKIVGCDYVISELESIRGYLLDATEELLRPKPAEDSIVVKPANAKEISEVLKYANKELITVVPRGGGTGLVGAAIPIRTSIVLSLERLNKILEVDDENLMIVCEAGVTLAGLEERLNKHDKLFFPCHPGDEGAQVGGMVVENAGGVRAVRHGIMRNHIKGMEVVLPTGEIVNLGGKMMKNNAGYDLMHIIIGSEGTLGIVTKVILRLYPKTSYTGTLLVSFDKREDATSVVPKILQEGIAPLAIEYMEREVALESAKHLGQKWPAEKGTVDLIFILNEAKEDDIYDNSAIIEEICRQSGAVDSLIAESKKEQRSILEIRSNAYTAFQPMVADALDMAVPPASIPSFMNDLFAIAKKYNTTTPAVGHVADGNIHNFIMRVNGEKPPYYDEIKAEMFSTAIKYGGTITAEHGTGKTRLPNMRLQFNGRVIDIMKGIKKVFDPNNILNPGTVVEE